VRLGLPWALGYPGYAGSLADVASVLGQGRSLPARTIVPLAIQHQLLRDDAATLLALVNDQDKPVALILEHESDPFGTAGVVAGLVHVLHRAPVPVLLLRTDTSALGAISHGAAVGAVGARSSLRHVFPIKDSSGGPPRAPRLRRPQAAHLRAWRLVPQGLLGPPAAAGLAVWLLVLLRTRPDLDPGLPPAEDTRFPTLDRRDRRPWGAVAREPDEDEPDPGLGPDGDCRAVGPPRADQPFAPPVDPPRLPGPLAPRQRGTTRLLTPTVARHRHSCPDGVARCQHAYRDVSSWADAGDDVGLRAKSP